ncbi:MAG TPA: hypothetical protein VGI10_11565 [Polyangiaceae bacterium]
MPTPNIIHLVRPYASEEEYLAREAWTIDARGMLLIEQEALPADTAIVFDVQIQSGHKPIRAEAKVVGPVAATATRPGGLRVRFKRFGTATKAFIDRAVSAAHAASSPIAAAEPEPSTQRDDAPAKPEPLASARGEERRTPSGVHRRVAAPVPPPANREELLEKLRTRAREIAKADLRAGDKQTG